MSYCKIYALLVTTAVSTCKKDHSHLHRWTGIATECVIGFSGVLFGLIPVETVVQGVRSYNVMGLVSIPAPLYPWALIVACQLLVRHVSFLGHLCGLLVCLGSFYCITYVSENNHQT